MDRFACVWGPAGGAQCYSPTFLLRPIPGWHHGCATDGYSHLMPVTLNTVPHEAKLALANMRAAQSGIPADADEL